MRILSYRNKRRVKKFMIAVAVILALLLVFCIIRFIYLQRYLVYDNHQVSLDFEQDLDREPPTELPVWINEPIVLEREDPLVQETSPVDAPMQPLRGYYVTTDMLMDMEKVRAALDKLEDPKTIMLDLKSIYGSFYYSSGTYGAVMASADILAINEMIEELSQRPELYLIARVTALSDNNFALNYQSCGLPLRSGALWMDRHGCYWLDPMAATVQEYLASIGEELCLLGFDEVVYDQFEIPSSENIVYRSEMTREEAAAEASKIVRDMLADMPIRVSYNSSSNLVAANSSRVYLVTDDGSQVETLVEGVKENMEDPAAQIVFLTASRDTRFDDYGVLRPLIEEREE